MYINLKNNKCEIKDFLLNDNIIQGKVSLKGAYSKQLENYFLHKIQEKNGAYSIFIINCFDDSKISSSFDKYEFLLSIDNINKIIIHENHYLIDMFSILNDNIFSNYQIWDAEKLAQYIKEEYKNKIIKLFDDNTKIFKKTFTEYQKKYDKILKTYKENVEQDYMTDRCDYELYFDLKKYSSSDLEDLQKYLKDPSILDVFVNKKFKEEIKEDTRFSKVYDHAEIQAKKELLKQIKDNPSEYVKLYFKIKNATQEVGKTLNITTKNNEQIKVKNHLNGDGEFRTVKGWNEVKITDISEITYGKSILFKI